jgi:hypothetical protein
VTNPAGVALPVAKLHDYLPRFREYRKALEQQGVTKVPCSLTAEQAAELERAGAAVVRVDWKAIQTFSRMDLRALEKIGVGVRVAVGRVAVTVRVGVGGSVHAGVTRWRQPMSGRHSSPVQVRPSSQSSFWQKREQPPQLCGGTTPSSQVSGYSIWPLPQVGHGSRQVGVVGPSVGQVWSAWRIGVGARVAPVRLGVLRAVWRMRVVPVVPAPVVRVASITPWTRNCSRAVMT